MGEDWLSRENQKAMAYDGISAKHIYQTKIGDVEESLTMGKQGLMVQLKLPKRADISMKLALNIRKRDENVHDRPYHVTSRSGGLQIKNDVSSNVNDLLIPLINQLMSKGSQIDRKYLELIKRSLEDLTSSFGRKITLKDFKLTPREVQICNLIKRGLSSKEIASFLNISVFTVGRHRHNIRKKLKIANKKENFNTFLQEL